MNNNSDFEPPKNMDLEIQKMVVSLPTSTDQLLVLPMTNSFLSVNTPFNFILWLHQTASKLRLC
jgi:hypothetical protein